MPYISMDWQDELAGVVYGETLWQAEGITCGEDWRNTTNPYSVTTNLAIFIISTELTHTQTTKKKCNRGLCM